MANVRIRTTGDNTFSCYVDDIDLTTKITAGGIQIDFAPQAAGDPPVVWLAFEAEEITVDLPDAEVADSLACPRCGVPLAEHAQDQGESVVTDIMRCGECA